MCVFVYVFALHNTYSSLGVSFFILCAAAGKDDHNMQAYKCHIYTQAVIKGFYYRLVSLWLW